MTVEQKLTKEIDEGFIRLSEMDRFSAHAVALRVKLSNKIIQRSRLTIGEAQAEAEE